MDHHRSLCVLMLLLAAVHFQLGDGALANPSAAAAGGDVALAANTSPSCCCDITCPSILPILTGVPNNVVCGLLCGCQCTSGTETTCSNPCGLSVCSLLCGNCQCKPKTCDGGWTMHNGFCYKYFSPDPAVANSAAEVNCQAQGGHLASIHSDDELHFVSGLSNPPSHFWIGTQVAHPSTTDWKVSCISWTDQSPVDYGNAADPTFVRGTYPWCPVGGPFPPAGAPSNIGGNANCVKAHPETNGCWNDWVCTAAMPYVCKKPADCAP